MEKFVDNPIKRVDSDALDNAYKLVLEVLSEIAERKQLSKKEIEFLTELIKEAYLKRKSNLFIQFYADDFENYLNHAFRFALNQESKGSNVSDYTKLFYYKSKKHLVTSDR